MSSTPTEIAGRRIVAQGVFIALANEEIKIAPFAEQPEIYIYIRYSNAENSEIPVSFRQYNLDSSRIAAISPFRSGVMRSTKEPIIIAEDETRRYELRLNYTLTGQEDDYVVNGNWIVLSGEKS